MKRHLWALVAAGVAQHAGAAVVVARAAPVVVARPAPVVVSRPAPAPAPVAKPSYVAPVKAAPVAERTTTQVPVMPVIPRSTSGSKCDERKQDDCKR